MPSSAFLRRQIEASLAHRIPSALTPPPRAIRPVAATGIQAVDAMLEGGLPLGAITEIVGPECSGRTSLALSFLAGITRAARVCAWIDVSDALDPESAAAAALDLSRLLWVRCGARPAARLRSLHEMPLAQRGRSTSFNKPWARIDQALRATDLLLQGGGFSAIVLDLGGIEPEYVSRVPAAAWFRYRASAERTQAAILLLTQHPCAAGSAELLLRLQPGNPCRDEATVLAGIEHRVEAVRRRFAKAPGNVVSFRKPPQRATAASWRSRTTWAGPR